MNQWTIINLRTNCCSNADLTFGSSGTIYRLLGLFAWLSRKAEVIWSWNCLRTCFTAQKTVQFVWLQSAAEDVLKFWQWWKDWKNWQDSPAVSEETDFRDSLPFPSLSGPFRWLRPNWVIRDGSVSWPRILILPWDFRTTFQKPLSPFTSFLSPYYSATEQMEEASCACFQHSLSFACR